MARNAKRGDGEGDWETWLECPICGWEGLVYYRTQPPLYCSDACKQKAYRLRKVRNSPDVTHLFDEWHRQGLGEYRAALERILNEWGPEAAQAAAKLALAVAREVRNRQARR